MDTKSRAIALIAIRILLSVIVFVLGLVSVVERAWVSAVLFDVAFAVLILPPKLVPTLYPRYRVLLFLVSCIGAFLFFPS